MNVKPDHMHLRLNSGALRDETRARADLASLVEVVGRRRWLALGVFALCLALAAAYVTTATRMFTATTMLVIDTKMTPPSPTQVSTEPAIDPAVVESQIEILKSDKIALDVVDRLGLTRDPEFMGEGPGALARLTAAITSAFLAPSPPGEPADPRQIAAGGLKQAVKILRAGRSFLAEIKATTRDPKKSAAIANGFAEAYIQDQLNSRLEESQRTADWMRTRLREVQERATAADRALKAYREAQGAGNGAGSGSGSGEEAMGLRAAADALVRARADLAMVASAAKALETGSVDAALDQVAALDDPAIRDLAGRLRGAGAAGDQAALAALRQRVRQLNAELRTAADAARLRVGLIDRGVADLVARSDAAPETGAEQQLEQAAQDARGTYEALLNRVTRVSAFLQQQAMPVTEARIVTAAAPPLSKSAPRTTIVLLLAACGGLVAGIAAAFVREMFDRRIRWAAQITNDLGLPYLGPLPRAARQPRGRLGLGRKAGAPVPLLTAGRGTSAAAVETLRSAKLMIDRVTGRERCPVVGIVSAAEHEGKATVATNLAVLAAEMRARVLLIDANLHDSRSGGAQALPGIGLAEAVAGDRRLAECVVATEFGFDLLPGIVGAPPAHPTEILASAGLRRLVSEAREAYDYVVVTIPAVLCTVDARAVEDIADAFILTVDSGRTTLDDVEAMFATCPVIVDRVVGVVLNRSKQVPLRRPRRRMRRAQILELSA